MAAKLWVGSFVPGVAFTRIDALSPKRLIKRVGVRVRVFGWPSDPKRVAWQNRLIEHGLSYAREDAR